MIEFVVGEMIQEFLKKEVANGVLTSIESEEIISSGENLVQELETYPGHIGWDLVCFRIRQLIISSHAQNISLINRWDEFWRQTSQQHRYTTNLNYDCPRVYSVLHYYSGIFQKLKEAYRELKNHSTENLTTQFIDSFFKIRMTCRPQLTKSQRIVFLEALKHQTVSPNVLFENLSFTKAHTSRLMAQLLNQQLLTERIGFSYESLKMKVVFMIVEMMNIDAPLPNSLTHRNPWIYSLFDCKFGNRFILVHLIVPVHETSNKTIDFWKESLQDHPEVYGVRLHERNESYSWRHFNYDWFDGNEWLIPGSIFSHHVRAGFEETNIEPIERVRKSNTNGFILTKKDMQLIDELWKRGTISIRSLRKKLGRDYNYVRLRYNELINREILRTRVQPSQYFAHDALILISEIPLLKHDRLLRALSVLPEVYASRTKSGYSVIIMRVPYGQAHFLVSDLRTLLRGSRLWLNHYVDMIYVDWVFPLERFSEEADWELSEGDFQI